MTKKDITIIPKLEQPERLIPIERDIIYDEIKNKYNIDHQHIENFKKGDDILYNISNRLEVSSIDTILLKNILKYTYPIINSYPNKLNISDKHKNILLTLDYNIYGLLFIDNKKDIQIIKIPHNTEISIVGIIFPFFSQYYYSMFNWYFSDNKESYFNKSEFKVKDNLIRNNIHIINKIINENITNKIFNKSPNNLIPLKDVYKKKIHIKYNDIISHSFLFNEKHDIELFQNIAYMIKYYLNFYDKNLNILLNQYIYKKNYVVEKLNYFYELPYYNKVSIFGNTDIIQLYNDTLDNKYKISPHFSNNIIYTFRELNLLLLYDYIYLYGFDNKIVKKYINDLKQNNIIINQNKENNKKLLQNQLINIIYERITKQKFPNLFNENHKDNIFNNNNKFNISKVPNKYKSIILLEYKKQNAFLKSFNNNSCPHIKLLKQFRYSDNIQQKNYYFKLLKEFINTKTDQNDYYTCNNCKFNIICPHSYELQIELLKLGNEKLSDKLNDRYNINQKIIEKYMSNAPVDFLYFCKICSEQIGKSFYLEQPTEFQDSIRLNIAEEEDETKTKIITTTYHIVLKYINFNILTINKKKLIFNIIDLIYPHIFDLEIQINKNQSYDETTKKNLIKLNIVIYIFASLIQILILNKELSFIDENNNSYIKKKKLIEENIDDKTLIIDKPKKIKNDIIIKKGSKENRNVNNIKILLMKSFNFITSSQNITINQLSLTSENIKQLLIGAYAKIVKQESTSLIDINTELHSIQELIMSNPIYTYVYDVHQIFPLYKITFDGKIIYKTNNNKKFSFEDILHKTNDDFDMSKINKYQKTLIKQIDNFSNILEPINNKFDEIYNNIFDRIQLPKFISSTKDEKIIDNDKIYSNEAYKYLSYKNFRTYIVENIYKFSPFLEQHNHYSEYDLKVIKIYNDENKYLLDYDKQANINRVKYNLKPLKNLKSSTTRLYKYKINNLNKYFSLTGKRQKFDILIFKNIKSKKNIEVKYKELDNFVNNENNEYFDRKLILVDKYNSKYNEYLTKIESQSKNIIEKNNNIIIENINKLNHINSFYNYYNIKCPVKDTHNYDKNKICSKCGITKKYINEQSESFYNQYKKVFNDYLENKENILKKKFEVLSKEDKFYTKDQYFKELKDKLNINSKDEQRYKINNNFISLLSKKYKINEKYLINIGISENKDYDLYNKIDIRNEEIFIEDRILKLKNILRLVIIYYNKLRYSENIIKFDNEKFGNIIHNYNKQHGKLKELNKLKELPYNFYNLINYYSDSKSENLIIIIMNIIWDTIYFILEQAKGNMQIVINTFIEFLLKRIMEFDEIYSLFNIVKLKRDKEEYQQDADNINIDYDYYQGDDDEDIDLEGDIINYDAFDLDLVDNDPDSGDFDLFD